MAKQNLVIADADAFIAIFNSNDANNSKALKILQKLQQINAEIFFPVTTISEAITSAQRKNSDPKLAKALVEIAITGSINILQVEPDIIIEAAKLYDPVGSKQNTFFDAIVASMAKKNHAAIFSFDKWYRKTGFKMAEDLIKAN